MYYVNLKVLTYVTIRNVIMVKTDKENVALRGLTVVHILCKCKINYYFP